MKEKHRRKARYRAWFVCIVLAIGFLAVALRALELYTGNYLFLFDQGLYYQDVRAMIERGTLTLIGTYTPIPGVFQGPYFYYLLAIFFFLFHGNPFGGMVLMNLTQLSVIIFGALLMSKLFGRVTGLCTAFFLAVSPSLASASRMLWPPYMVHLFAVFYIYSLVQTAWGKNMYVYWSIFGASVIVAFEIPAGIVLYAPILILVLLYNRNVLKRSFLWRAPLVGILPLLPQIIFNIRHDNIMLRGILGALRGLYTAGSQPMSLAARFSNHFGSFWANFQGILDFTTKRWEVIVAFAVVFVIYLIRGKKLSRRETLFLITLGLIPVVAYIEFLASPYIVWSWYLLPFHIVYLFIFGFLAGKAWEMRTTRVAVLAFVIFLSMQSLARIYRMYTVEVHDTGGVAKIKGKLEAIDYIYQDAKDEKFNLLIFTPPVYTYAYDYLLWWYARPKYGYMPTPTTEGLFYLLIEPDPEKPWSYNGWLETVIKKGDILNTQQLPAGFIVQKRTDESYEK